MSQAHENRYMPELRLTPLYNDAPVNESTPNWAAYRLSLGRIKALQSESTHWRVTCSFPTHGVDYRDYVRANFTEFNPLTFHGQGICKKTEYMNVRGHNCTGCTSAWWQREIRMLSHDSSYNRCEFGSSPGAVDSEDNFGQYGVTNPNFRCSSSDHSTTNYWFGRRVAWTSRAVNDRSSKYLFWGNFPPRKHETAYNIIEEVNIIDPCSRFLASAFPGNLIIFRLPLCVPEHFFFFSPSFLARQKRPSWEKFLSLPPGWKSIVLSPGWENRTDTFSQPFVDSCWNKNTDAEKLFQICDACTWPWLLERPGRKLLA